MKNKILIINNEILKLIALIAMTLSHVGLFISSSNSNLSNIFLIIGSISFPLFLFLNLESNTYTSSNIKYILRLLIMSIVIYLGILIISLTSNNEFYKYGNIFIDLLLYSLIYFLIIKYKSNLKYIYLFIIFIYFIITHLIKIDIISINNSLYKIVGGLFPQYNLFGLFLFLITLLSFKVYTSKVNKINKEFINSNDYKFSLNIIYCIILAIFSLIAYAFTYIDKNYLGVDLVYSTYIVLGALFIIFYNHKKVTNSKIIKYSFYLYYPLHLVILYLIFML